MGAPALKAKVAPPRRSECVPNIVGSSPTVEVKILNVSKISCRLQLKKLRKIKEPHPEHQLTIFFSYAITGHKNSKCV